MRANELVGRHRTHGALAVASRVRLLDALRSSERPLDARELAAVCGLHVSTVRFHLGVLSEAGLVRSHSEQPRTRGRPRLLYAPASVGDTGAAKQTGYQSLAMILAAHWDEAPAERARRAERAGWAVAREQGVTPRPSPSLTAEESVAQVSGLFAELGFEPELAREGQDLQIRLHACPFRAVAAAHPEVVCSMHLGLLRGALVEVGAPATTSSLRPFVEPHLCVAHISPAIEPAPDTQSPQTPNAANQP
ncbi:MAG: helix-turn-helix domain-containing protein [Pseudonocardiaceae bacterium]